MTQLSQAIALEATKPDPLPVIVESIPFALKDRPQWMLWRYEWNGKKWDKIPYQAKGSARAKSNDPTTWVAFALAVDAYTRGGFDGIAYGLAGDDPFTMVDLDKCAAEPWAVAMIDAFDSYTEESPSGNGYRIIIEAAKPKGMGCKAEAFHEGRAEVYESGRFMTITGHHVPQTPATINERSTQLAEACAPLLRRTPSPAPGAPAASHNPSTPKRIREVLRHVPNDGEGCPYEDSYGPSYMAVMMGVHDETSGQGYALFREWSARSSKHNAAEDLRKWDSLTPGGGVGFGSVVKWAQDNGFPKRDPLAKTPEQVAAELDALNIEEPERPGAFTIPESCRGFFIVRAGLDMARVTEIPEATAVITALGAFSGIASMAFSTGYADGNRLPLGLYTVAEQPPATAKSRLLNSFATPWLKDLRGYNAQQAEDSESEESEDGKGSKPEMLPYPFSNATPEAMEQAMELSNTGHFWLQSAEQGAIRMLFGDGVKDRPKNFDLALKGFNGEFHASARVTRKKLQKEVYGAITVLAQAGSIRTILANSDGDGLAERFLYVAEPHNLGRRTHEGRVPDPFIKADYENALERVLTHYQTIQQGKRGDLDSLHYLGFSDNAHEMLRQHRIRIEGRLAQHADNGEMVMTAILGKSDMQAMKLAAVMYLGDSLALGKPYAARIPDEYLTAGLELALTIAAHVESVLVSLDKIGPEAARDAIRRQFDKRAERTIREVVQNVKKVKPFRDNPSPSGYAKRIITGMVNRGDLLQVGNKLQLG
ncbi:DUF3987 domain-containing protein [Halomonas sp. RA08-2]|uniref:DUF3987 domain-containing protein n=1 Tax=Halomonas sp. RA08-2 TaxID=3440842 RepID=UPI003EE84903